MDGLGVPGRAQVSLFSSCKGFLPQSDPPPTWLLARCPPTASLLLSSPLPLLSLFLISCSFSNSSTLVSHFVLLQHHVLCHRRRCSSRRVGLRPGHRDLPQWCDQPACECSRWLFTSIPISVTTTLDCGPRRRSSPRSRAAL